LAGVNFRRLPYEANDPREVSLVVNNILAGKLNSTGTVTLAANAATTVVADDRAGYESVILFMPTTAAAASEQAGGAMFVSSRGKQTFTVTHANTTSTTRTFDYIIIG
jgi:hypothetical protein